MHPSAADQLGDVQRPVESPIEEGLVVPVKTYLADVFGIQRGGAGGPFPGEWGAVGMLGALGAFYLACSYMSLRFLQHQKR